MITERTIHNYLKWLEKAEAKATRERDRITDKDEDGMSEWKDGQRAAFAVAIRRLKKLLK